MAYHKFNPNIESVHFHCTSDLKEKLFDSAEARGLTVSAYLRMTLTDMYANNVEPHKVVQHA